MKYPSGDFSAQIVHLNKFHSHDYEYINGLVVIYLAALKFSIVSRFFFLHFRHL